MPEHDWAGRWREGKIGFHEGKPNPFLVRHVGVLGAKRRVLVPLCGKAEDLAFLASRGHRVVGVEYVEAAAIAFFEEHGVKPAKAAEARFPTYSAGDVTIVVGDFYAVTRADVGAVDAFYDRAALIAVEPESRDRYVGAVRALVPPGSPGLLVTFDYPPGIEGPPHSVPEPEVRRLYGKDTLEVLSEAPGFNPRVAAAVGGGTDRAYRIVLKG